VVSCDPSDTIKTLKDKIDETEGIDPTSQSIYFGGYLLNDQEMVLGDMLTDGDELTLSLPFAESEKDPRKFTSNCDTWIVNGSKKNFKLHLVKKGRPVPIKLKEDAFGLVYHKEGEKEGERIYQVERFIVEKDAEIILKNSEDKTEVYLNGNIIDPLETEVFDERKRQTKMELASYGATIAGKIGRFLTGISAIIYPGIALALGE